MVYCLEWSNIKQEGLGSIPALSLYLRVSSVVWKKILTIETMGMSKGIAT